MAGRRRCMLYSNNVTYHLPRPCMFCQATFGSSQALETQIVEQVILCPSGQTRNKDSRDTIREKLISIIDKEENHMFGGRFSDTGSVRQWSVPPSTRVTNVERNLGWRDPRQCDSEEFLCGDQSSFKNRNSHENRPATSMCLESDMDQSGFASGYVPFGGDARTGGSGGSKAGHASTEEPDVRELVRDYCCRRLRGTVEFLQMASQSPCLCLFAVYRLLKLYALYALMDGDMTRWSRLKQQQCPLREKVLTLLELFASLKVDMNLGTYCEFDIPLMIAVATGDEDVVGQLLKGGANPDISSGPEEVSSLALAILLNSGPLTSLLLEHGASATNLCTRTLTPLRLSFDSYCSCNFWGGRSVVQALIQHGARLQDLEDVEHPLSALGHAVSTGNTYLTEMLIRFGADINQACGRLAPSYLHLAVGCGDLAMVELLQRYGVRSAFCAAATETTALGLALSLALQPHLAAQSPGPRCAGTWLHIVKALLQGDCGRSIPSKVESMGGLFPPLHVACFFGHLPSINLLLKAELRHLRLMNPTKPSKSRDTRKASMISHSLPGSKVKDSESQLLTLDDLGANQLDLKSLKLSDSESSGLRTFLNQEHKELTPVMQLASKGHHDALTYLLELGADPLHFGRQGSLLHSAVSGKASPELLQTCLQACKGKGVSRADALGNTPLHLACRTGGPLCEVLCQQGAKLDVRDWGGETPLSSSIYFGVGDATRVLLEHGADPDIPDKSGATAIYWAIFNNRVSSVQLLLEAGCHLTPKLLKSYPANLTFMRQPQHKQLLVDFVHQPRSLMHLCRHVIRRRITKVNAGTSIQPCLTKLPIPVILQDFLMLRQQARASAEEVAS